MTFARPERIVYRGRVAPVLATAATALGAAGWRVTSIFRPDAHGLHRRGEALDVAPMTFTVGGINHHTARRVLDVLTRACPGQAFDAIAEDNHVHVDWRGRGSCRTGLYLNNPRRIEFMNYQSNRQGPSPDPSPFNEAGEPEDGEPSEIGEFGEYGSPEDGEYGEWGEPEVHVVDANNRCVATGREVGEIVELGGPEFGAPGRRRRMVRGRRRRARRAARRPGSVSRSTHSPAFYELYIGIMSRISGPVAPRARLRRAEAAAVCAAVLLNPAFAPQVFPFTTVGPTLLRIDIDSTLSPVLGPGVLFDWAGDIVKVTIALLSAQPTTFQLTRTIAGNQAPYSLQMGATTNGSVMRQFNSNTYAAAPRITNDRLTTAAVPTGTHRIEISGLPTGPSGFNATLQHFVPGDSDAEATLRDIGALS